MSDWDTNWYRHCKGCGKCTYASRDEATDRALSWDFNWAHEVAVKTEVISWSKADKARAETAEADLARAREALECALDEYEQREGRILDQDNPHWSVAARAALPNTTGEAE